MPEDILISNCRDTWMQTVKALLPVVCVVGWAFACLICFVSGCPVLSNCNYLFGYWVDDSDVLTSKTGHDVYNNRVESFKLIRKENFPAIDGLE